MCNMYMYRQENVFSAHVTSIFMDTKCKPQLAVNLTRNYSELLRNFVADSHNHDVCVSEHSCVCVYMYMCTYTYTCVCRLLTWSVAIALLSYEAV